MTESISAARVVAGVDAPSQLGMDPPTGAVADSAGETLMLFRGFLAALSSKPDDGSTFDLEKMLEEYGRLRIWTEQTGATLQERGSLDDTLHGDHSLRAAIASVFTQLQVQLRLGMSPYVYPLCLAWPSASCTHSSDNRFSDDHGTQATF